MPRNSFVVKFWWCVICESKEHILPLMIIWFLRTRGLKLQDFGNNEGTKVTYIWYRLLSSESSRISKAKWYVHMYQVKGKNNNTESWYWKRKSYERQELVYLNAIPNVANWPVAILSEMLVSAITCYIKLYTISRALTITHQKRRRYFQRCLLRGLYGFQIVSIGATISLDLE